MNVIRFHEPDFSKRLDNIVSGSSLFDKTIEERTRAIVDAVSARGDAALVEFTEKFNGIRLEPAQFAVTTAELLAASLKADDRLRSAVAIAGRNIAVFSRKSLRRNWSSKNAQGATVGEKFDPFRRVGIYIPGGTAPLVSTALMTVGLAKVAGCQEIAVSTPCDARGEINGALLYAIRAAGATEIYRLGGAQAIAALALGTATVARVQKVFGPGNAYVVAAKRLIFGHAAVDLLPGPSEVLVLADETANARFAAADLLAQAEHGSGHERVWLVTTSLTVLKAVEKEIERQLPRLTRREFIRTALKNSGYLIQVATMESAVELVNRLAPEHCEVMTRHPSTVAEGIVTAGAIFLGSFSPTVLGDYIAGPSHTLPTGGAGASFAGLTVDQFQRRTSVVEYNRAALKKSVPPVLTFAELEGLGAHGQSAAIRLEKGKGRAREKAAKSVRGKRVRRP